jgi:adenylate kinase family enzyme
MVAAGKIIPAEMIVRMLRKIIYSGDGRTRFILSSFPDIIEQAKEFEKSCATISAIIYAAADDAVVEIKNNNLTLFNIDALFQKEFRLKTVKNWSEDAFEEFFSPKIEYHLVYGRPLSGKTTVSNILAKQLGFKVFDYKAIEEKVRKTMGTDEEPFEGDVPTDKVNQDIANTIHADAKAGRKMAYVFDGI